VLGRPTITLERERRRSGLKPARAPASSPRLDHRGAQGPPRA
jgi:hypothetical protein